MMMLGQSLMSSSRTSVCMFYSKWMKYSTSLKTKVTYLICYKLNKEVHSNGVTLCHATGP